MTTRKSLPLVLILLLCSSLLPIYANSAQPISIPISDNPNFSCYRDAASITARIQFLTETYPNISKKVSIGESFEGASIYALEIGNEGNLNKPHFILLSGLHGNDFSQPEIALQFAEILLGGYETNADLQWIVDNVEVDLILLANPDGRIMAEEEAKTAHEPEDVDYLTNKNNVDLEKNYCFKIEGSSEGCSTFTFQPETQAVINYLNSKLGSPIPNQPPQYDSQNLFIYFSSHNKETPASSIVSNYQGKLRIPKFYTPNPSPLTDLGLLHLKELTEMLRIFGTDPKSYIETFKTEGLPFSQYPVDYAYFSHGVASIELSAPPKDDSKPMACYLFTSEHIQNYIDLFVKAAKSAVRPFKIGYGPIVDGMAQTEFTETEITFHATISEKNQIPDQPEHNAITSIHYYIDQPKGTIFHDLADWKVDENNPYVSVLDFKIPTESLSAGKHTLTLQACSQDEVNNPNGECGLPFSAYLFIPDPQIPDDPDPTRTPVNTDLPNPDPTSTPDNPELPDPKPTGTPDKTDLPGPDPTDTPDDPDPPETGSRLYLPLIWR